MNEQSLWRGFETVGSLLSGAGTLLAGIKAFFSLNRSGSRGKSSRWRIRARPTIAVGVLAAIAVLLFWTSQNQKPDMGQTKIWDALSRQDYREAYEMSTACVAGLRDEANRLQTDLAIRGVQVPPTGVLTGKDGLELMRRGQLNDMATCLYTLGDASEHLGRVNDARQAYTAATWYTYARTWNLAGFFWSPAGVSQARLQSFGY